MKIRRELKIYLVILFFLCPNVLWAKFVPEETARQVAVNQMNMSMQAKALRLQKESAKARVEQRAFRKMTKERIGETFSTTKDDIVVYYVFNFSPEGWAIISADDVAYPVIGYSESGIYDPNIFNQPPAFIDWMDNVAAEIAAAVGSGLSGEPEAVEAWEQLNVAPDKFEPDLDELAKTGEVMPLIKSTWGQGDDKEWGPPFEPGYNKYCPWEWFIPPICRDYCPTGCVATAMAQIMRYWQWPPFGQGSHGYDSNYGWRYVDFSRQYYNWSAMPLDEASNAIALLMRDIGVAVDMDYKTDVSSASISDAAYAYREYFRYDGYTRDKENFPETYWIDGLKDDLDAGRPIFYSGAPSTGAGGHAFICDGYSVHAGGVSFHFNWGWDGKHDGWYLLSSLTPGDHNYTKGQAAVFGIEPKSRPLEVYVDDDYSAGGDNEGHDWHEDAFDSIQDAILIVHPGGTVYVAGGLYWTDEPIDFKGKAIHLYAMEGAERTTINGSGANVVVSCISGEGPNTILEGFTITGGGTGMANHKSSPTVTNCTFRGNSGLKVGGGMHNLTYSSPTVTNCTFSNNSVSDFGGGMFNYGYCNPTVTNCIFSGNSADDSGGGMASWQQSNPTVKNCTFSENWAKNAGGAMFNRDNSSPTVTNCTFSGDSASYGGAMFNQDSSPTVSNCTFSGNVADTSGGGMANAISKPTVMNCTFSDNWSRAGGGMANAISSPTVSNCTFSGNVADTSGGGMANAISKPTVMNCTFSDNSSRVGGGMFNGISNPAVKDCTFGGNVADRSGGGMYNEDYSSPTVTNCTFSGNVADGGGGGMANINSSNPVVTNCILWGDWPNEVNDVNSLSTVGYSDVEGGWSGAGGNNIDADPWFADMGYWADANDPNIIAEPDDPNAVWVDGDYHLLRGSPCIDAGDPNYVAEPNETDLDGNPRVVNGRIDMGAYEFTILNTAPVACIVGGDRVVEVDSNCEGMVVLDGSCSSDADSAEGTNDDINDFGWYDVIDVCDPNSDIYLGSSEVIECNLGLGEHLIVLEVTDKAGLFDSNEAVITVEDATSPVIALNGAETVILECGVDSYVEEGATASDNCDDDVMIVIGGDMVDASACGTYVVTYDATDDSGNAAEQVVREVMVEDTTGPVITLNGSGTVVLECGIDSYVEEGAAATDNCDEDVAVVIGGDVVDTSACGTYVVTYDASDSWGNDGEQVVREVIVDDTMGPVIALNGSEMVVLECGVDSYVEEGATATDNCDDNVAVVKGGDVVDTSACGTYIVTYDGTDDSGNAAEQVLRTVLVEDTTPPEFSLVVEPNILWPPNHKMVLITPSWEVSDNCDEQVEVFLVAVTSSEDDDSRGGGHTSKDIRIGDDGTIYLRAERSGKGRGRVYTITYQAVDDSGNVTEASATVTVPHRRGPTKLNSGLVRRLRRQVYRRGE